MKNCVRLLINRKWKNIPAEDILYITISDKLSFLHLKNDVTLNLFITLAQLETLLPETDFIRISRNCIVNFHAVFAIHDSQIRLADQTCLSYSKRREKLIADGYRHYLHGTGQAGRDEADPQKACPCPCGSVCQKTCQRLMPLLNALEPAQLNALERHLRSLRPQKEKSNF